MVHGNRLLRNVHILICLISYVPFRGGTPKIPPPYAILIHTANRAFHCALCIKCRTNAIEMEDMIAAKLHDSTATAVGDVIEAD